MQSPTEERLLTEWYEGLIAEGKIDQALNFAQIMYEDKSVNSLILLVNSMGASHDSAGAMRKIETFLDENPSLSGIDLYKVLVAKAEMLATQNSYIPAYKVLTHVKSLASENNEISQLQDIDLSLIHI